MVAGDLVNTASRIQSAAEPGTVLVGETTRRTTEQAIAYEEAGTHELKGKAEPVELCGRCAWSPARAGALKSAGLEAPFVGRERELKLIKELFHGGAHDRRAHLVSVTGIAGIGKSRLAWEFYKYFDGIVEHRLLAPGPLPRLRRGRRLLGARRHGADALPDRVRTRSRPAAREAARDAGASTCSIPTSGLRRAAAGAPARARGAIGGTARTCSPRGGCSSSGSPTRTRRCSPSRTCSGRTRACSTSSSTCSSGRATTRCT